MDTNLSTLKRLAVCLGCCECTEDNPACTNAEAIDFICDNLHIDSGGVTEIVLDRDAFGVIKSGYWIDSAGKHKIKFI